MTSVDDEPRTAIGKLVSRLEARDPYAKDHSFQVRTYAVRLAQRLGLSSARQRQIGLAARLHDIGKLGLSREILNKPARLTDGEMAKVREHPAAGVEMVAPIIRCKTVLAAIRGHHERFDGGGYPDGLAGDRIGLEARIIAIADVFDALLSTRCYRLPLPRAVAVELIRDGAGTQFDPHLVQVFLQFPFSELNTKPLSTLG
jgi:HD-GYP domain-containing protein (c-di-GMP phosphodiesterase class II)